MIEAIRDYIAECPYLDSFAELNVEYLVDKVNAYSLTEGAGYNPVVEQDINGNKTMQFQFSLDAKFYWNEEIGNNVSNSNFFENFRNWLDNNNRKKIYPNILGIEPETIEATTNGFIFATDADVAIYRISCVFTYFKPLTDEIVSA